jgi:acetyl-CoA synthetase
MADIEDSEAARAVPGFRMTADGYRALLDQAAADPVAFWEARGRRIAWMTPYTKVLEGDFTGDARIRWFGDGTLNASVSCLDRHLATQPDKPAIIWEGDDPAISRTVTYRELHAEVCRFANALRRLGVARGDRVCLYLPMVIEAAVAMLACARIGAIHTVVFGGFSPDSLANRIQDAGCRIVVTADEGRRGGRKVALKANVDRALEQCPDVVTVVVVGVTGGPVPMRAGRDHSYAELVAAEPMECAPAEMNAEDPLFTLYTSGSTGKPKGVLHTTGGYLVWASFTHELVFDLRPDDVFWCTADVGWVTGHSYIVYGPLANGATTLMFEGIPTYPDASRFWRVIDKHRVTIFYTAPTAIRSLMRPRGGRGSLPDRRHLVADRDRRHPDQPGPRRGPDQARLRDIAVARGASGAGGRRGAGAARPRRGQSVPDRPLAGHDAHGVRRPCPVRADLLLVVSGKILHR